VARADAKWIALDVLDDRGKEGVRLSAKAREPSVSTGEMPELVSHAGTELFHAEEVGERSANDHHAPPVEDPTESTEDDRAEAAAKPSRGTGQTEASRSVTVRLRARGTRYRSSGLRRASLP